MEVIIPLVIILILFQLFYKHIVIPIKQGLGIKETHPKNAISVFVFWFKKGYDFVTWLFKLIFGEQNSGIHGTAGFMEKREQRRFLHSANDGLTIDGTYRGRITLQQSTDHVALVAPSGTGKTTRYVLNNIFTLLSDPEPCSIVVLDPSSEVKGLTLGYAQARSYRPKVINVSGENTLQYNPFARADSYTEIKMVIDIIIDSAYPNSKGEQDFWVQGGKSILNILMQCLKKVPDTSVHNLANLKFLLNSFGMKGEALIPFISKYADSATFTDFKSFLAQDSKVILGQLSTGKTALEPMSDPKLCQLLAKESLNFESLRSEPSILYITVPEHQVKYYSFFLKILYTQLFDFCMKTEAELGLPYLPIYFLMDEFGNAPPPNFSNRITTLRKRKVSCSVILQDIQQLTSAYGQAEASTILNGACSSRIFYPGLSYDTCIELERILGKTTVSYSDPNDENDRVSERGRSLLTADEIRRLGDYEALYLYKNKRAVRLQVSPYYDIPDMVAKSQIPFSDLYFPELSPVKYINLGS